MFTMHDDLFLCIQKTNNDVDGSEKISCFMNTMKTEYMVDEKSALTAD